MAAVREVAQRAGAPQGRWWRLSLRNLKREGDLGLDILSPGLVNTSLFFRQDVYDRTVLAQYFSAKPATASLAVVAEKWWVGELQPSPPNPGSRPEASVYTHTPRTPDVTGDIPSIMRGLGHFRELVVDLTVRRWRRA